MQKQEFETIISEQLTLFNRLKEEFISQKDFEMAVSLRGIEKYLIDIQRIFENKREIPEITASPNFFKNNYSVGRFHTAMIGYIIQNSSELANTLFEGIFKEDKFKFEKGKQYHLKYEYERVDLVVCDDNGNPVLLIEMKVDDHEIYYEKDQKYQLQRYDDNEKFKNGEIKKVFITLGIGQCAGKPSGKKWHHLTLEKLVENLGKCLLLKYDKLMFDWFKILEEEQQVKSIVEESKYKVAEGVVNNREQIYRYGKLIKCLQERFIGKYDHCSAFMYGTAPDLILNFGYGKKTPVYMEITNSLELRMKIDTTQGVNIEELKNYINDEELNIVKRDKINNSRQGKSITFYVENIGLTKDNLFTEVFSENTLNIIESLRQDLEKIRKNIETNSKP
jgi:hypothetical protein